MDKCENSGRGVVLVQIFSHNTLLKHICSYTEKTKTYFNLKCSVAALISYLLIVIHLNVKSFQLKHGFFSSSIKITLNFM